MTIKICDKYKYGRDPCGVRTDDAEVARQTPYPLGHRSPQWFLSIIRNFDFNSIDTS